MQNQKKHNRIAKNQCLSVNIKSDQIEYLLLVPVRAVYMYST